MLVNLSLLRQVLYLYKALKSKSEIENYTQQNQ